MILLNEMKFKVQKIGNRRMKIHSNFRLRIQMLKLLEHHLNIYIDIQEDSLRNVLKIFITKNSVNNKIDFYPYGFTDKQNYKFHFSIKL